MDTPRAFAIPEITLSPSSSPVWPPASRGITAPSRNVNPWIKDGKLVEGTGAGDSRAFDALEGAADASGLVGNSHPGVIDPAAVTAVSLGGIRIDPGKLTLQEKEPVIRIPGGTSGLNQENPEHLPLCLRP